jgi:RimJ/RimL family protein N-acetyltransferase
MKTSTLSVRPMTAPDVVLISDYWCTASDDVLRGMGADPAKMPTRDNWHQMLHTQLETPMLEKKSWCMIWLVDDVPAGHCNINKIVPGREAYMHLHLWQSDGRQKGMGAKLVAMTLPYFFENYSLEELYCEPYALNPAPNRTLAKVGFKLVRQEVTTPGILNFEQEVNLWKITKKEINLLGYASKK